MGKVYAGTSNQSGTYNEEESTSGTQDSTNSAGGDKTFYAFAQANENYEFDCWVLGSNAKSIDDTSKNPAKVTVSASSTANGTNTGVVYAKFKKKVLPSFGITFETSEA
ncbi:MAG: hypothetical protein MJ114_08980, partial [Acetatifactor sp.]|nr:hypothetical protein [Acetatifactor sp.]